ncbi:MAG: hypothetical protein JWO95_1896, partial [Verrucomicrobiales bacterium]|nr:hypothetical protein [Verrucomicrobiales bacterium]
LVCGCKTKQTITRLKMPAAPLAIGKPMYVSVPEAKGKDEERTYEPSDFQTATAVTGAFRNHGPVTMGREPETKDKALASAAAANCVLLIKPTIRMWEDNPTEWSGEPDDLEIELEIFDVASKDSLARANLKGKSKWATFGDHPEDMLPGFFEPFAAELFGDKSFGDKKKKN